jgi:hypothetical protein
MATATPTAPTTREPLYAQHHLDLRTMNLAELIREEYQLRLIYLTHPQPPCRVAVRLAAVEAALKSERG